MWLGVGNLEKVTGPPTMPKYSDSIFAGKAPERAFPNNEPRTAHDQLKLGEARRNATYLFLSREIIRHPSRNWCGAGSGRPGVPRSASRGRMHRERARLRRRRDRTAGRREPDRRTAS